MLTVGGFRVMDGGADDRRTGGTASVDGQFVGPFTALVELTDSFQQAQGDLARISDLLTISAAAVAAPGEGDGRRPDGWNAGYRFGYAAPIRR